MGNFVKARRFAPANRYGMSIPAGNSATRPEGAPFGTIRFNTDLGFCEFYNGSVWQNMGVGGAISYTVDDFTGTGAQTVFTMSIAESSAEQLIVFVGSIYQIPVTNYTVDGGYDITFTSAPPNGIPINVIHTSN